MKRSPSPPRESRGPKRAASRSGGARFVPSCRVGARPASGVACAPASSRRGCAAGDRFALCRPPAGARAARGSSAAARCGRGAAPWSCAVPPTAPVPRRAMTLVAPVERATRSAGGASSGSRSASIRRTWRRRLRPAAPRIEHQWWRRFGSPLRLARHRPPDRPPAQPSPGLTLPRRPAPARSAMPAIAAGRTPTAARRRAQRQRRRAAARGRPAGRRTAARRRCAARRQRRCSRARAPRSRTSLQKETARLDLGQVVDDGALQVAFVADQSAGLTQQLAVGEHADGGGNDEAGGGGRRGGIHGVNVILVLI